MIYNILSYLAGVHCLKHKFDKKIFAHVLDIISGDFNYIIS